jgi:hypothetical protein
LPVVSGLRKRHCCTFDLFKFSGSGYALSPVLYEVYVHCLMFIGYWALLKDMQKYDIGCP